MIQKAKTYRLFVRSLFLYVLLSCFSFSERMPVLPPNERPATAGKPLAHRGRYTFDLDRASPVQPTPYNQRDESPRFNLSNKEVSDLPMQSVPYVPPPPPSPKRKKERNWIVPQDFEQEQSEEDSFVSGWGWLADEARRQQPAIGEDEALDAEPNLDLEAEDGLSLQRSNDDYSRNLLSLSSTEHPDVSARDPNRARPEKESIQPEKWERLLDAEDQRRSEDQALLEFGDRWGSDARWSEQNASEIGLAQTDAILSELLDPISERHEHVEAVSEFFERTIDDVLGASGGDPLRVLRPQARERISSSTSSILNSSIGLTGPSERFRTRDDRIEAGQRQKPMGPIGSPSE